LNLHAETISRSQIRGPFPPPPAIPRVLAGTVYITRSAFQFGPPSLQPERKLAWNRKQYGLCTNPHWHGHNYVLEVTVSRPPDPVTGYIIDLGELKRILHRAVVDQMRSPQPQRRVVSARHHSFH